MVELGELEVLAAEEDGAQQGGGHQPDPQAPHMFFWMAASASTIVRELMRRTKAETEV